MDKNEALKTVKLYAQAVNKVLKPEAIVLYGSHVKGTADNDSDLDVAVIFNGFTGDFLKTSALLCKLRRNISADIEPILLDSRDDRSGFVKEVLETGVVV